MERIWRWNTEVKKLKWKFIPARICSQKLPWGLNCRVHLQCRRRGFDPWVRKILWRRKWQPTPVFLPGKSHGQRSLAGYSSWDHKRVRHDLVTKKKPNNKQRSQRERQADRSAGLPWVSLASWLCCCCSVLFETLWDLLDCSIPGSSVLHYLLVMKGIQMKRQNIHWGRRSLGVIFLDFHPSSIFPREGGIFVLV